MAKKFKLQIPEPCHEDWNKMSPVEQGRFCDSCQKAVVDFTGMSDTQLIAFFKKPSTGSVCGRFFDDQLNRDFDIPKKRLPWLKYFFQFSIPIFLTSWKAQSQGEIILKQRNTPTVCTPVAKNLLNERNSSAVCNPVVTQTIRVGMVSSPAPPRTTIAGMIMDEKTNPIPFATVYIKGTEKGTMCDSTGFFKIDIAGHELKITLSATCVGYLPVEKQVNLKKENFTIIVLNENASLSGEVVVTSSSRSVRLGGALGGVRVVRTSYFQKLKDLFTKDDSVTLYPNPAKTGSEIRIKWKQKLDGEYILELFSLNGQLIQSSFVKINPEMSVYVLHLSDLTPGPYAIALTNRKSGKKYTEKIIIQ